jgi:hypothetical protein
MSVMECSHEGSLPYLHKPVTEPTEFSPKTLDTLFLKIHFNNILHVRLGLTWGFLPVPL